MKRYEGSCAFGAINYRFEGEPINAAFCYCKECQKRTGSDKWFGLWVPTNQFNFTKGAPAWAVFPERIPMFDALPPDMGV